MAEWTFPQFGHGADYNPDQWRHIPGTLEEDIRLMKAARCNLMNVGIFSWAALEPEEGRYDFDWLQEVLDKLHAAGISVFLATPSGARPAWMSRRYPEVLRVREDRLRNLHGDRHNHCYTSPAYRMFVLRINTALAERFGTHPTVVGWHISNEYGGECHCPLCQWAFRDWLKRKYGTLEALNHAWWTGFWAKTYSDWSELVSPSSRGESAVHGLKLDWQRFVTHQTMDFMRHEIEPLRRLTPKIPITTNLMGRYEGLDNFKFGPLTDVSSFDSYPRWGAGDDAQVAMEAAFTYDLTRSFKRKPWVLMESTPSMTNWMDVCKPKRPGMHLLSSMQAVAHGADTVQYFQWRKSRGACEKLHGAVVDHCGHENTRVFRDVAQVGEWLSKLAPMVHAQVEAKAAVIYDWNNRWAIGNAQGPRKDKRYDEIVTEHYAALRAHGVNIDVIDEEQSFAPYRLLVAPMMYLVKPGVAERMEAFVQGGGTLVATYWTGIVDENDLCFLGGFPGPLRRLLGIWSEEIDALYPGQTNGIAVPATADAPLAPGLYACDHLCDLIHAEGATVLATYANDFYAGRPALTKHAFGAGEAWYIAAHTEVSFLTQLYAGMIDRAGINRPIPVIPRGVQVATRQKDGAHYLFALNFSGADQVLTLPPCCDMIDGTARAGATDLPVNGALVVEIL